MFLITVEIHCFLLQFQVLATTKQNKNLSVEYGLEINLRFEAIQLARVFVWGLWRLATALYAPLARQNHGTQVARNHSRESLKIETSHLH